MPTRTINLKMVLGRKESMAELRRALWTTHHEINQAVKKIEEMLLLCRGAAYRTIKPDDAEIRPEEVEIPESQVIAAALAMARGAQRKNGKEGLGTDEEVLGVLRRLYEKLVPSCIEGGKGDAQQSNAWVSPLMDPDSKGGLSVYEKIIDPPPKWIEMKQAEQPGWEAESAKWLETSEAKRLQKTTGSPPAWVRRLQKEEPWQELFIKDQENKRKELEEGNAPLIKKSRELGLLPLISPVMRNKMKKSGRGAVSPWDRLAVRLAVGHFLSWESWNHSTKKAHDEAKAQLDSIRNESENFENAFEEIREYEKERFEKLKRVAFFDEDKPYKINPPAIRAWPQIREEWKNGEDSFEKRMEILARLQTMLGGKFGDPVLFRWLAAENRKHLWQKRDTLTPLVKCNVAEEFLEKRKPYSLMTFADARLHPRWTLFEAPGGSNLRNYGLEVTDDELFLTLDLLQETGIGKLGEKEFRILLAKSDQFTNVKLKKGKKGLDIKYRSAHQSFEGKAGGAEILFDRLHMGNRDERALAGGAVGPVWFKLTLDVAHNAPKEWIDGKGMVSTPPVVHHYNTALSNKSKHVKNLAPGLRVLSVDLGQRTFAACSVFELVEGKPDAGIVIPTADGRTEDDPRKLWAVHERSFTLCLPGETPTTGEIKARKAANDELHSLKRDIQRLKAILRFSIIEDEDERDERINSLMESIIRDSTLTALDGETIRSMKDTRFRNTPELWRQHCKNVYDAAEKRVAERFGEWRRRTRPRTRSWQEWRVRRNYHGGKSMWMIEYLEFIRKTIIGWNLRGRTYGEVNRQNRKTFGTIAAHLLTHINNLKEDRTKTGGDLIVQAARGFIPRKDGAGWVHKHKACRVILFEDLARYRFRVDRPRRENSRLMKWNHREVAKETEMQAELYGITVNTTAAGFSSRYLASNGAPGVRCRRLTKDDFDNGLPKPHVARELAWMLPKKRQTADLAKMQNDLQQKITPGMIVPWHGGQLFASIQNETTAVHSIHADINAAQNLQRRFWLRNGEAFRISCKKTEINGETVYKFDKVPGARLLGALQQMENGDPPIILKAIDETQNRYKMVKTGGKKSKPKSREDGEEVDDGLTEALAELDESSDERETFFRDPSGLFFHPEHWVPSKHYWSVVKQKIWKSLSDIPNVSMEQTTHEDIPF